MEATKRKIIELKGDTFRNLSIMAAEHGTNLKKYIEEILDNKAETYDDSRMYKYLLEHDPDGQIYLNEEEKKNFENWLGI